MMNSIKSFPASSLDLEEHPSDLLGQVSDKLISISMADCDWLELPCDVLSVIINKVISFSLSDYIRFAAVCSKWRCFCLENYEHIKIPNRTPILVKLLNDDIILESQDSEPKLLNDDIELESQNSKPLERTESFYSLSERKCYYFQLPVPFFTNCRGSGFGWIILQDKNFSVGLLNPFRSINNEIQLPRSVDYVNKLDPSKGGICIPIKKAVLSTSPSSNPNDFILMAVDDYHLMEFYKSGDEAWTHFRREVLISDCRDVVYYKGHFFVITYQGSLLVFDSRTLLHSDKPKVITLIKTPPIHTEYYGHLVYLVESSGDLLLVYRPYPGTGTVDFKVFKLVEFTKWVEVNNLDGRILFLSKNGSMSVSASDLPGYKPNCIYFAGLQDVINRPCFDLSLGDGHHMGMFNLEDKSFEPHCLMKSRDFMMALSWIQPTL